MLLACEENRPNPPPAWPPPSDASPIGRVHTSDAGLRSLSELEGLWTGEADTREYGHVRARLYVDADAWVFARITGEELLRRERFRLTRWNGVAIEANFDGLDMKVPAHKSGEHIRLELPEIGSVQLTRTLSPGLNP